MAQLFLVFHVLLSIALITLVLLQRGKGAEAGAAFGGGASGTVFGAQGSSNFLSRATAIVATLFFITSLTLAYLAGTAEKPTSVVDTIAPAVVDGAAEEKSSDLPALPEVPKVPDAPAENKAGD
jgi:preprotein translocase subunit SecG